MFGFQYLYEESHINICYDNESLYKICSSKLGIEFPTYEDINKLIVDHSSSVLSSIRFKTGRSNYKNLFENSSDNDYLTKDLKSNCENLWENQNLNSSITSTTLLTNLIPCQGINFISTSYSPFYSEEDIYKKDNSTETILSSCLDEDNYMIRHSSDSSMSLGTMLNFRGDAFPSEIVNKYPELKSNLKLHKMLDTGFTCRFTNSPWFSWFDLPILRSVSVLNNTIAISSSFEDILKKFDTIISKYKLFNYKI